MKSAGEFPPTRAFYDELAPFYDLVFEDWDASIERQGAWLHELVQKEWPGARTVLDASAGIGTQALGLAARGYEVTASDLSSVAVQRAAREAERRGLVLRTEVADFCSLSVVHGENDVVIACDNALPHLLSDGELLQGLRQCRACVRPGGGFVVTLRDYPEPGKGIEVRPHGVRERDGARHLLLQVWDWDGPHYDVAMYVITERPGAPPETRVFRSRYYAIPVDRMQSLMEEAGFAGVRRAPGFYQPALIGTRPS